MIPTDAIPAAEFLLRHLYRSIEVADGKRFSAVAENENCEGDNWFWNDDNAKSLEFLSRPEVWRRFPAKSPRCFISCGRCAAGRTFFGGSAVRGLNRSSKEGSVSGYLAFAHAAAFRSVAWRHWRWGAFSRRENPRQPSLTGNRVEFTHRRRRFRLNVESAIRNTDIAQEGNALRLRHSSDLYFTPRWRRLRLGELTYIYTIDARSMLFDVEAVLDLEPGREATDVVLTVGHDALDHPFFTSIGADTEPTETFVLCG